MTAWALDLGTTNSGLAYFDEPSGQPRFLELPAVCRQAKSKDPLEAPRMTPSAVDFVGPPGLLDRVGSWPLLARHFFLGRRALIGRPALERNEVLVHPSFVPAFKPALSDEPLRLMCRIGRKSMSAREVARAFLRELLVEAKRATGEWS